MKKSSKLRSAKRKVVVSRPVIKWPKRIFADLSTSHIPEKDALRLYVPGCPFVLATETGGCGHFLNISERTALDFIKAGFSMTFAGLMVRLQDAGFDFVYLDADAPVVKGLPVYPW